MAHTRANRCDPVTVSGHFACERLRDRGVLLVYDIRPREELLGMLVGDEIQVAVRRRVMTRLTHSRLY